ncbi:MAG TPA: cation-transporting P-type ATPase [Candidatus Eisenbacteria bacterium]|nr:cation-transporting P-type ATPase [Candidatus Eisenbacteria bacterium]
MNEVIRNAANASGERSLSEQDLYQLLGTGSSGLTTAEAERRLRALGRNQLQRVRRRAVAWRLLDQFANLFALLLWISGILAFVAGMAPLGWAILAVLLVNGVFAFLQEYRAERAMEALEALLPHTTSVIRDGASTRVPAWALVPGDLVHVEEGDQIPADGQLVQSERLRVDQGPLSGESHPVFKLSAKGHEHQSLPMEERHELAFAGTGVVVGSGSLVVTATGMRTEVGRIARLTQEVGEEPSPLQRELGRVTRVVAILALSFGAGFVLIGIGSGLFRVPQALLFGLGVIVANVPEGLMPTLTLALAWGVQRMARRGSLVRRLSAVETLGAVTVICTDKTGTLTENRMQARGVWTPGRFWDPSQPGDPPKAVRELLEAAVLASEATLTHGDPTERALIEAAALVGLDPEGLRASRPIEAPYPFDSFRKRMTLVHREPLAAYTKGAPRETIALCERIQLDEGTRPLRDDLRAMALSEHERFAAQGLRVLAVATREAREWKPGMQEDAVERNLVLLGLVALWDPPRPEVSAAMAQCRRAGIRVIMVTGDDPRTAANIAARVGLQVNRVVTGKELADLPREALHDLVRGPNALVARASPSDKLLVVQALRELQEIVVVTGDGVNDAPALKAAHVGVAMGRRGTEVAREAAAMVVTDDNFASIVVAIEHGRSVYANVGKFVTYIFASNVPELVPFLAAVFFGLPLPLTVMQILAVDLGTDLLPALALGAERPEPDIMDQPPRPRTERLLPASRLMHAYAFLGLAEAALSMFGFFSVYWTAGWRPGLPMAGEGSLYSRATTMTLAGIVAGQIGNVFACRTQRESVLKVGLFSNPLVAIGVGCEVVLLLALIHVPFLARAFGLAPLHLRDWALLLTFPLMILGLEEGRKWLIRVLRARA